MVPDSPLMLLLHPVCLRRQEDKHLLTPLPTVSFYWRVCTFKIAMSSVFAIGIRSVSALSTTNTTASMSHLQLIKSTCIRIIAPPIRSNIGLSS